MAVVDHTRPELGERVQLRPPVGGLGDVVALGPVNVKVRLCYDRSERYVPRDAIDRCDRRCGSPPRRIIVIPCGGAKLAEAAPAGELYVGSYHRACRRAADALAVAYGDTRTLILSAKHGLVGLDEVLEPYDLRVGDPGAVDAGQVAATADRLFPVMLRPANRHITVLAGKDYADLVSAVWPDAHRPLDGCAGIGEQLRRLKTISEEAA